MTFPTIHSNGSTPGDLCTAYNIARRAIESAHEALAYACPNARNYYPQGDDAFRAARAEHEARLKRLEETRAELEKLETFCADAMDARAEAARKTLWDHSRFA